MDLQGKVIAALPARSGTSARGEWKAQDFVIETHENFPHKMVFSVFGDERLQRFNIQIGQEVNVSFDIDAHEYNGRWFNSIRAFDVRQIDPASLGASAAPAGFEPTLVSPAPVGGPAPVASQESAEGESADDLPF